MKTTDYEQMRNRHHDGMCGGDCPECYVQQLEESYREQEREAAYELAREEQARLVSSPDKTTDTQLSKPD